MTLRQLLTAIVIAPLAFACLPAAAGSASPTGDDPVVARINDTEIRRSDIVLAQQLLPAQYRKLPLKAVYPTLLDQIINNALVVGAARSEGLDKSDAVRLRLAAIERRLIEGAYLERAAKEKVTPAALRERYKAYAKSRSGVEEIRARHILVKTEKEAQSAIDALAKGEDFVTLARKRSMGPTKARGGDLGFFTRESMVGPFAEAAFALKIGQVTAKPVQTRFGWHVIKLAARRPLKVASFEASRERLSREIRSEVARGVVRDLKKTARIEAFDLDGKPRALPMPKTAPKR
jgi:peptidyl-prolyl cis-trans isomerase C